MVKGLSEASSALLSPADYAAPRKQAVRYYLFAVGLAIPLGLGVAQYVLALIGDTVPPSWAPALFVLPVAVGLASGVLRRNGLLEHWVGRSITGMALFWAVAAIHLVTLAGGLDGDWHAPWLGGVLATATVIGAVLGAAGPAFKTPLGASAAGVAAISGLAVLHGLSGAALGEALPSVPVLGAFLAGLIISLALTVGAFLELHDLLIGRSNVDKFRVLAEALPFPILLSEGAVGGQVLFANESSRRQLFAGAADGPLPPIEKLYNNAEDLARIDERLDHDGTAEGHMVEMRRSDGSSFWALTSARSIAFNGLPATLTGFIDITDRKMAEEALLASEVRYALISRAANDGIWDWDIPSGTVYFSSRWKEIVGAEPGKRLSTLDDWFGRVYPDDLAVLKAAIDEHLAGATSQLDIEYRVRHGDGRLCWMQCRGIALRRKDGTPIRMAGSQSDITLRKTYETNLRNAAYEDRLTGLNNRAFFTHLVDTRGTQESIEDTAILLFNIDQFRRVNDNLGTGSGDALLIAFARRLSSWVKPQDALCRLGADEFGVWLSDLADHHAAMQLAGSIVADLSQPYTLGDAQLPVIISSGLATASIGGANSGADLLHNAKLALDRSKQLSEGRCVLFDEQLLKETKLRQRLSRELATAGRLGQIFLEYQPVVALLGEGRDRVAGFEALMRWRHPELGLIPPGQFVPLAEEAGLIGSLGMLAIEHAARDIGLWSEAGLTENSFSVAVNLSARQISDAAGVQRLYSLLDRLTLPTGRLKLEITESVLMNDPDEMAKTFRELRDRGVELSLDDFGTGYSSLSYLHRFPLNVLKVDRSFVTRMLHSPEALRLVRSIIELGHDLGLAVVAEGVEEAEEVECLRDLGCDFGQGYFFSRPVPAARAEQFLASGLVSSKG